MSLVTRRFVSYFFPSTLLVPEVSRRLAHLDTSLFEAFFLLPLLSPYTLFLPFGVEICSLVTAMGWQPPKATLSPSPSYSNFDCVYLAFPFAASFILSLLGFEQTRFHLQKKKRKKKMFLKNMQKNISSSHFFV